eukprot:COSAG06_NODE_4457_length_4242_cov_52.233888_2_plen_126_part_00
MTFGKKHWFLLPPHEPNPPVMRPCDYEKAALAPSTLECEQASGEVLFIPSGWWHATCNLDWVVGIGGQGLDGLGGPLPPLHRAALSGDLDAMRAVVENLPVRTRYISHRLCLPQAFRAAAKLSCE